MAQIFFPAFVVSWGAEKNSTRTVGGNVSEIRNPSQGQSQKMIVHTVVVDDLDANVTVQSCGDDTGDDSEHVADRLPGIGGKALV